jgi:hypothetical protein
MRHTKLASNIAMNFDDSCSSSDNGMALLLVFMLMQVLATHTAQCHGSSSMQTSILQSRYPTMCLPSSAVMSRQVGRNQFLAKEDDRIGFFRRISNVLKNFPLLPMWPSPKPKCSK